MDFLSPPRKPASAKYSVAGIVIPRFALVSGILVTSVPAGLRGQSGEPVPVVLPPEAPPTEEPAVTERPAIPLEPATAALPFEAPRNAEASAPVPAPSLEIPEIPAGAALDASASLAAGAEDASTPAPLEQTPHEGLEAAPLTGSDAASLVAQEIDDPTRTKPFAVRVKGSVIYDDNVSLSSSGSSRAGGESDLIFAAGGGFTWNPFRLEGKRQLTVSYDGAANFYTDHTEYNGGDHNASISGLFNRPGTNVSLSAGYTSGSGIEKESRQFQDQQSVYFSASVSQEISGKLSGNAGVNYHAGIFDSLQSTDGFSASLGLTWALTAKATAGVSLSGGYTDSDSTGNQTYESLVLTGGYAASGKLRLNGSAGVQRGATVGSSNSSDELNPTFQIGANYEIDQKNSIHASIGIGGVGNAVQNGGAAASQTVNFDLTANHRFSDRLSGRLKANRSTPASAAVANASIERTSFSGGLSQSLTRGATLSLDTGYEMSDYVSTYGEDSIDRSEDTWFLRSALGWTSARQISFSIFYDLRSVSSDNDTLAYDQNRIGLSATKSW